MNLKGKNTQKDREKLVKTFAQDISLFTAYVLEPYITRPFSPFHLELFQELYGMVLRFMNKTGNLQNNLQPRMSEGQTTSGPEGISSGKMGSKAQTIADGYREIAIRNKVDSSPITLNLSGNTKSTPTPSLSKEEQEEVNIGRILLGDDKSLDSLETGPRIGRGGVSDAESSRINQAPADFTSQNEISNAERSVGQSAGCLEKTRREVSVLGHEIKEVEGLLLCMERKRLISCLMEVLGAREGNESVTSTKYEIRMEGAERLVVAAPRGFAKSTIAAEAFPLWCICNRVCEFILIVSETEDQAKMRLDMIRNELEHNERLRGLYGDLVGKENWGSFEIETLNGVKVVVKGTGQKIRGLKYRRKRPELVICDDIMAEDTVEQEEQRGKVKRWFYGTVIPGVSLDGMMLFIGTVLHEDDILVELLSAPDWRGMRRKVIEGGKPLWPEAFSMERIENIRREYTQRGQLHLFYREYMNEILASEEAAFTRECFQYVDEKELVKRVEQDGELFKVFLTMDIAYQTEGRSDFTALVVTYMDEDHNLYVADVVRARMGLMQTIDKIFNLVDEYLPSRVGIQNVDWTRSLKVPLIEEMRRRGKGFVVTPLQTYSRSISGMSSKKARIERLAPRYHAKQIYHVTKGGVVSRGILQLEEELLLHPRQKWDDVVDSLSSVLDLAFPPQKRSERHRPLMDSEPEDYISKISGY